MTGELSALASAFLGTFSSTLLKREAGTTSALVLSASRGLVGTVIYFTLLPFFGGFEAYKTVPPAILALLVLSTLLGQVIGDTLYFRAIMQFGVARTMPIASSYPLVSTLLAIFVLGEPLGWTRLMGVVFVVGGLILLTQQPGTQGSLHRGRRVGFFPVSTGGGQMWLLLLTPLISGINVFLVKPLTQYMNPVLINCVRQPIIAIIMCSIVLQRHTPILPETGRRRFITTVLIGHILGAGISSFLFLTGIQLAGAGRGGTLASTGPLFALLMAPLMLGEKITPLGIAGSVLTVIGVWLLL